MRIGEPDGNQATAAPSLTELGQAAAFQTVRVPLDDH